MNILSSITSPSHLSSIGGNAAAMLGTLCDWAGRERSSEQMSTHLLFNSPPHTPDVHK